MELHPRLNSTNLLLQENKIILGSFPVWSLTKSDNRSESEEYEKQTERIKRGDIDFFYGSSSNMFWPWYQQFLDQKVLANDIKSITSSLTANQIGITDVIISCDRKGRSALDKHLYNRKYNYYFFRNPFKNETIKILCTSKGLMNEMLLTKAFFKRHASLSIDYKLSNEFQDIFLSMISKDYRPIKKPFFVRLINPAGGCIECLAIPSPGSPFRRLIDFGLNDQKSNLFLDNYLNSAFRWFMS